MHELKELLQPTWGAEKWILEGWQTLNVEEKALIQTRMDAMFQDGLPFELHHPKIFYIYTFALLAQLEVLAIQIPLKFGSKMSRLEHRVRLKEQLLDEIFHGLVFTKIVYLLSVPRSAPPEYNLAIERMINTIRDEQCPKIALILLNLIGEGWIEEIFYSLHRARIAPRVFDVIIADEHRHVAEADLYLDIGLPNQKKLKEKIGFLEEKLMAALMRPNSYRSSLASLLGHEEMRYFQQSIHNKYTKQLNRINLTPGQHWNYFMSFSNKILPSIQEYAQTMHPIAMTPMRKILMSQWGNPMDPTMVAQFNLEINALDFFNKKFPSHTLTTLMLQSISACLMKNDPLRNYLRFNEMYHNDHADVGLVVHLPHCKDHLGTIVFRDCHKITFNELSQKIKSIIPIMTFCYQQREALESKYAHLQSPWHSANDEWIYAAYPSFIEEPSIISFSNIGACNFTQAVSPLRRNEAMKVTALTVTKQLIWDPATQAFVPQDLLPISWSADHRVFDGNIPCQKLLDNSFREMFDHMIFNAGSPMHATDDFARFQTMIHKLIKENIELAHKTLVLLQTYWCDYMDIPETFKDTFDTTYQNAVEECTV